MQKIHFIGIGGIGMSALARYYNSIGYSVSGSDKSSSEVVLGLQNEGIPVQIGENENNIPDGVEKIVYTIAISQDNLELRKAKKLQAENEIALLSYPEALGEMTKSKKVIAVCGTHGKTTTTAMTYSALKNAGVDLSMIVGSLIEVNGRKTNYVPSQDKGSEWIVIEACEYKKSFLNYSPQIILLTNIDNDHLDFFKDLEEIKSVFQDFVNKASTALIIHKEENYLTTKTGVEKIICEDFSQLNDIDLSVPGVHNRKNAQLVIALAERLGLDKQKVLTGLKNFKGTWRRQEYKGKYFGVDFYDDYAHHPTEIRATLQALKEKYPEKKILAIFHPHLYSRTKLLFQDFVNSFSNADEVAFLPIYAAREKPDPSVSSELLSQEVGKNKKSSVVQLDELPKFLEYRIRDSGDILVVTLGAGNIYDIYSKI